MFTERLTVHLLVCFYDHFERERRVGFIECIEMDSALPVI